MPEIKNTFLKSKMNKDLDARLIPNGEYREGQNISVSTSEGSDVGALENIRGNIKVTDFNLTGNNLEIIGYYADVSNNRIYFFITNFSDSSIDSLRNYSSPSKTITLSGVTSTISGADHYICYCEIPSFQNTFDVENIVFKTLVTGTFLNFSKTHPILGVNLLENLLFWTDNRNQPRKINVEKAISNSSYYNSEDNVSVAKYAPFSPISFLKNTTGVAESTLINEKDEWLAPFFGLPGQIYDRNAGAPIDDVLLFGNSAGRLTDHLPAGTPPYDIRITSAGEPNKGEAIVKSIVADVAGDFIYIKSTSGADINDIATTLGWSNGTFLFQLKNPNYNASFAGDKNLLENKFVRFSYRFKYDENDYSLTAPFSQHAFVPKQYGYFVGIDSDEARESSIVSFMENQITTAGLVIELPHSPDIIEEKLKVSEIQLLYKASDEQSLKVIKDLKIKDITGSVGGLSIKSAGSNYGVGTFNNVSLGGGSGSGAKATIVIDGAGRVTSATITISGEGYLDEDVLTVPPLATSPTTPSGSGGELNITLSNTIIYKYSSEKPTKVLPEKEIVRVSDIIPLRAATQEVVGNRIIYGNFLQNKTTPDSLRYSVSKVNKGTNSSNVKKELINHNLKQNRSYQVGVVLQDRYGRASNVILSDNELNFNSSFFSNYSNGGTDPLTWGGDSLKVEFDELIPSQKTNDYIGIWNQDTNPLGWYTYKLVVKQQEQDYYNIYTAGNVSGNFDFEEYETPISYSNTESVSQIALFNDNINKIPRNLKEVGPSDKIYSSSTILYNRVKQTHRGSDNSPAIANIGEQNRNPSKIEITNIKPFREIGDWTTKKNIDMHYVNSINSSHTQFPEDTFIYPGYEGTIDPFFMKNNKNPLIATLKTNTRLGYIATSQQRSEQGNTDIFAKKLNIFETDPFKSSIDIYYETSTSGLISDFNNNVDAGFGTPAPGGLTDINIQFRESTTSPVDVSNTFQIVNTQGQPLNNATCRVLTPEIFTINSNGQRSQVLPSPVTLQEIQAAALPSTPPIYKLTSANTEIFNSLSTTLNNYIIKFTLKVDGFADVTVEEEFNLTNVKPSIYKIMSSELTFNDGGFESTDPSAGDFWFDGNFIDNGGLQAFLDSDENNPIDVVNYAGNDYNNAYVLNQNYIVKSQNWINRGVDGPVPVPNNLNIAGGEAFERSVSQTLPSGGNTLYLSSLYYSPSDICYFGFTTNGAELISSFSETNDAKFVNTGNVLGTKDEGVRAKILSVTRYNARFNGRNSKIYCTDSSSGVNQIDEFTIRDIQSGPTTNLATDRTGGIYPTVSYTGAIFQNSDFVVGSNFITGWRGAYMYYIKLGITDASDAAGSLPSLPYYVKLVIYNNFS